MPSAREGLERRLADLAEAVAFPPTPEIAPAVRSRLEAETAAAPPRRSPLRPAWRTLAIALGALLVAGATAFAASPGFRDAVFELLGVKGVRIERVPQLPQAPERPGLEVGDPVSLDEAASRAGQAPLLPSPPALRKPDRIHLREVGGVAVVSLVWEPGPSLPESAHTGAGLLLSQFRARLDRALFGKLVADTRVSPVRIGGVRGYWLRGAKHVIAYRTERGRFEAEPRLAGNTLVWQRGPVTLRLEGEISKARALRIARSLR